MRVGFYGGVEEVTDSCFLLEADNKQNPNIYLYTSGEKLPPLPYALLFFAFVNLYILTTPVSFISHKPKTIHKNSSIHYRLYLFSKQQFNKQNAKNPSVSVFFQIQKSIHPLGSCFSEEMIGLDIGVNQEFGQCEDWSVCDIG